jgi:hypothetical protein
VSVLAGLFSMLGGAAAGAPLEAAFAFGVAVASAVSYFVFRREMSPLRALGVAAATASLCGTIPVAALYGLAWSMHREDVRSAESYCQDEARFARGSDRFRACVENYLDQLED